MPVLSKSIFQLAIMPVSDNISKVHKNIKSTHLFNECYNKTFGTTKFVNQEKMGHFLIMFVRRWRHYRPDYFSFYKKLEENIAYHCKMIIDIVREVYIAFEFQCNFSKKGVNCLEFQ